MPIDPQAGAEHLTRLLAREGPRLGLVRPARLEWVYNEGNFQNASYRVTDGGRELWVKLVPDPGAAATWFRLRERLARTYRAPPFLARLPDPEAGITACVFPLLAGRSPDPARCADLLGEVARVLDHLHADAGLAADLAEAGAPTPTLRSAFGTGLLECLTEDLRSVRAHPEVSRWLDAETVRWLADEADALATAGEALLPEESASAPVHGDPWLANVLSDGDDWHLLDWDGIRLGDPAADHAMLHFDAWTHGASVEPLLPPDEALRERVRFLLRAASFDAIVDPLSDVAEMPAGVPRADAIRGAKRRRAEAALGRYRRLFPR